MTALRASAAAPQTAPAERFLTADYARPAQSLARRLLGQRLVRILDDGARLSGIIVEAEAYIGVRDRASHAFNGRRTARNESMYTAPGAAYVYFTYGMHEMFNVVCGREGEPVAVLIRALEPQEGLEIMSRLRPQPPAKPRAPTGAHPNTHLCSGPGKLCQALAIDRSLDREDLATSPRLFIERARPRPFPASLLVTTARVGVESCGDWAHAPLRWFVRGNPHVSRGPRGLTARG